MNHLQIFNSEIIPVYISDTGTKVVIGRELHERLKIGKDYSTWFKDMCNYGFSEPESYSPFLGNRSDGRAGKPRTDHYLTLDMAKHIAMIQRTPQGFAIRQKLIELEKNVAASLEALSPQLQFLINIELKQKEQSAALDNLNSRMDNIGELVSLSPNSWRPDARHIISKIATKLGGFDHIRDINAEINALVNERAGVSLETRLTNKRRRMADEGVCVSKRNKLTHLDVVAEDKKLIEIYTAIVKEMAVKYGVVM